MCFKCSYNTVILALWDSSSPNTTTNWTTNWTCPSRLVSLAVTSHHKPFKIFRRKKLFFPASASVLVLVEVSACPSVYTANFLQTIDPNECLIIFLSRFLLFPSFPHGRGWTTDSLVRTSSWFCCACVRRNGLRSLCPPPSNLPWLSQSPVHRVVVYRCHCIPVGVYQLLCNAREACKGVLFRVSRSVWVVGRKRFSCLVLSVWWWWGGLGEAFLCLMVVLFIKSALSEAKVSVFGEPPDVFSCVSFGSE